MRLDVRSSSDKYLFALHVPRYADYGKRDYN